MAEQYTDEQIHDMRNQLRCEKVGSLAHTMADMFDQLIAERDAARAVQKKTERLLANERSAAASIFGRSTLPPNPKPIYEDKAPRKARAKAKRGLNAAQE